MPLLGMRHRIWAIVTTGLRREIRRTASVFVVTVGTSITALATTLPAIVFSLIFPGAALDVPFFFTTTFGTPTILFFVTLMAAVVGGALIADDIDSMALTLYLSRPIGHFEYLLAKAGILFPLVSLVGLLPLALPPFLAALLGVVSWEVGLRALAVGVVVGLLLTAFFAGISLFLSSLTRRKSYAAAGVFAMEFGLTVPAAIIAAATSNPSILYLSPWDNVLAVARAAYGAGAGPIDWPPALAILLGVTTLAALATYLRMRAMEVVTG